MANHTYSKGLLYKKTLNSSGEVTGSVPLLLKTLGSLVIMSDGTDAETAISTAISNMVTPDETTIVTGQDGITISVKKSTSAEIDEILGDVPTEHTWEGYYTKSEVNGLVNAVDAKFNQNDIETALGYTPIASSTKGSANGVASLDANGLVPSAQLPSYVDDAIESATFAALPATGETGKIYVTLNDNKTYRWSGSAYVEISQSLALGETSSTAFAGDKGKTAYEHSQTAHARTDATNAAIVSGKLNINGTATNIGDFKAVSTAASQGLTDTEKANALANIGAVPNSDFVVAENNISYVSNQIGKNQLDTSLDALKAINTNGTWNGNVYTHTTSGATVTVNADNTLTVKKTGTANRLLFYLTKNDGSSTPTSGTKYAGYILSGCPSDGSESTYSMNGEQAISPWSGVAIDYGNGYTIHTSSTPVYFYLTLKEAYTTPSDGMTFKPMICTAEAWEISHEFEPYALSNHGLTVLEAEDRDALAEEIDAGAKNILAPTDLAPYGDGLTNNPNLTCTNNGDGTYTLNGSTVGNGRIIIHHAITSAVYGGKMLSGCPNINTSSEKCRLSIYTDTGASGVCHDAGQGNEIPTSFSPSHLAIYVFSGNTFNNVKFYPMICTKAAFSVSPKFVPYRPNYDFVCQEAVIPHTGRIVYCSVTTTSRTATYTMKLDDFYYSQLDGTKTAGSYLVSIVIWNTTPRHELWLVSFTGGNTSYAIATKILGNENALTVSDGVITIGPTTGKITISTLH